MAKTTDNVIKKEIAIDKFNFEKQYIIPLIIFVLAAIPFGLGKYIEFNSPGAFDCGAYVYSAQHILQGAKIGVDEMPSAQQGNLIINILGVWLFGFNDYGPKFIQAILQATALITMFFTLNKFFGRLAATVSVILASIYLSAPLIAKYGNVKEQFMVSFAIIGVCIFLMRQNGGKWWLSLLSGAVLVWATLFKQTGFAVIGGMGVFVILQPILKNRTYKQTIADILLLFGGAAITLIPIYVWLMIWHNGNYLPFDYILKMFFENQTKIENNLGGSYIANARKMIEFSTYFWRIIRYYWLLILPISLALCSIIARIIRILINKFDKQKLQTTAYEKFVLLFAVWWVLDMAFVWISPRSYEEYFIPLNGSASMLAAYIVAIYADGLRKATFKGKYILIGFIGLVLMIIMSWHIFFGITKSPHSNTAYGSRQRGYAQKIEEIKERKTTGQIGTWEATGQYIKQNSIETDTIFVWGWVPGIYVQAQRLSSTISPFTSEMHVINPNALRDYTDGIIQDFQEEKPLFIVDTHNMHFPYDRPPLELWLTTQKGILPNNPTIIEQYEQQYRQMLKEKIGEDEAMRFDAMKPFRDFVMSNYIPVKTFGNNIIFKLKSASK